MMPAEALEQFRRYRQLIEPLGARMPAFVADAESANVVQVERGVVYSGALNDVTRQDRSAADRLIELSSSPRLASLAVVDRSGHHRPVYRGLLVYSWLQAFRLLYETLPRSEFGAWENGVRAWCDLLESDLGQIEWPARDDAIPAGRGASATEAAMAALTLHVAGKVFVRDAFTDLASDTFGRLTRRQQPSGAFLLAGVSDNPDTHAYHELVVLHAAASYAVQAEDRGVASAVARATRFHMNQTQPDHATEQPWALFAFLWNPESRPLADQILHACAAGESSGVSLLLLADALYCLRLFEQPVSEISR
jgi:hypothetical protein